VDHRTSWVRRVAGGGRTVFVKSYEYATWRARFGNWGRWTAPLRASRPAREAKALQWLAEHGLPSARPLLVAEWRVAGFLERATLVTAACDGAPADRWLAEQDAGDRRAGVAAIRSFVDELHRLGFRDRNLDLRNLLVRRLPDGELQVRKIDSPRFVLTRPGRADDRLARADRERLEPQLRAFDDAAR